MLIRSPSFLFLCTKIETGLLFYGGFMEEIVQKNKMEHKKVFPLLMTMAFPPMISMLIQSLYNIVDSMFVAMIDGNALTAVSLAFPIQNLLLAFSVGIGVGVNSYIARKLGEKDFKEANQAVAHGFLLSAVASVSFLILGLFFIEPFFHMFTSDQVIFDYAVTYTNIVVFFCFGSFFHICIEKIFQATGKMIFPMAFQAIGAITNIILDPIFIFGYFGVPAMGVAGAAIATVIGQIFAMLLSLITFLKLTHDVKLDMKNFSFSWDTIKKICTVGIPNTCMNALGSVLTFGLNAILIRFSTMAVSLFGIYFKLQTFVFMPASGLSQGAMPIMGYNYGAGNSKRLKETVHYDVLVSFVIMCIGTLLFFFGAEFLLSLFQADAEMVKVGVPAIQILCISFIPASFGFSLPTLFQAMGKGFYSLLVFLLRQFAITLPLSFILSQYMGLTGIWISFIIAESAGACMAYYLYRKVKQSDPIFKNQKA